MFDNTPIYKFLEQVRSQIRYRPAADKVCRELTEHMEDRMDGLAARGVPGREAAEQAVAAMGDPYEIGREIDRLYSPFRYQFSGYVLAIALGLLLGALTNNFLNTFSYHRLAGLLPIAPAEDLRYPMRPAPEDAPAPQLRLATVYGSGTLGPYTVHPARDNGTAGVYPSPPAAARCSAFP